MSFSTEQFQGLLALQELDTGIEAAERRLAAARSREELGPLRERVMAVETLLAGLSSRLSALRRDLKYAEQENQGIHAEIAANEKRLYGGQVRNPKEAAQLQSFVDSLRRRLGDGQEKAIELMLEIEPLEPRAAETEQQLASVRAELEAAGQELSRVEADLDARLPRMREERSLQASVLPAGLLSPYEALRTRRPGTAVVASIVDGKCTGCRVGLPFLTVREARSGALRTCDNCGRILVG
jgi:predicted  nucleic acid-binding Zn-ribbon protein